MEEWREIIEFPGYSVSSSGLVRNDRRNSVLTKLVNQQGLLHVGLVKDGVQHKRALGLLVADAFLNPPPNKAFNTVIHLDGDKLNTEASNLMWRPKWFALSYHRQWQRKAPPGTRPDIPIEEVVTLERFADIWLAVKMFGLLWHEVYTAAWNFTYHSSPYASVWPTGQQFRILKSRY